MSLQHLDKLLVQIILARYAANNEVHHLNATMVGKIRVYNLAGIEPSYYFDINNKASEMRTLRPSLKIEDSYSVPFSEVFMYLHERINECDTRIDSDLHEHDVDY